MFTIFIIYRNDIPNKKKKEEWNFISLKDCT